MRTSSPGPPDRANAAPWLRWLFPAAIAAGLVTLLALPRGAAPGVALSYTKFLADVGAGTVRAVTISPGGQVTGQAVAAKRDRNRGGERVPAGQAAGDLAGRADGHRADRPGADISQEPGIAQRHTLSCAARQGQQRHQASGESRREQPPPPWGGVRAAGRGR